MWWSGWFDSSHKLLAAKPDFTCNCAAFSFKYLLGISLVHCYYNVFWQTDIGGDIVDWDEDGWGKYDSVVSFNPYQSDLAPLEVRGSHLLTMHRFLHVLVYMCVWQCSVIQFLNSRSHNWIGLISCSVFFWFCSPLMSYYVVAPLHSLFRCQSGFNGKA